MRQNAMKFQISNAASAGGKKKGARGSSRGFAEHTTTVRNTSKNIYKPCFNMPKQEKEKPRLEPAKKQSSREAAKQYAEEQRKKRQGSQQRNRSRGGARTTSEAADSTATDAKVFSKPKLQSSKGSRASTTRDTAAQSEMHSTSKDTSANSAKPPLKPGSAKAPAALESASEANQPEESKAEGGENLAVEDNLNTAEEIESRYSDDKAEEEPPAREESKEAQARE